MTTFNDGFRCFLHGLRLVLSPTLRPFVIVPLLVNVLLFAALSWWVAGQFGGWLDALVSLLPDWLAAISRGVLAVLLGVLLFLVMGISFLPVSNVLAAPFNGLLAEKAQLLLAGVEPPQENPLALVSRSLARELRKLLYFAPRTLGVLCVAFLLSWIPLVNVVAPVLTFVWGAWYMVLQYLDYCEDNQQREFNHTLSLVREQRSGGLGFGAVVMLAASVPVLNWFVMPVAICGAASLWVQLRRPTAG